MNNKWKNVILACSLLFNLVLAGFIAYSLITRPVERPYTVRIMSDNEQLRSRHREIRTQRLDFFEHKNDFMRNLASSDFTGEEMREQLEVLLEKQIEMERTIGSNLIEMRENMTAEQAARFFNKIPHIMRDKNETIRKRR